MCFFDNLPGQKGLMGIRGKLIFFVVGFLILVFALLGSFSLRFQRRIYDEEISSRGRSLLEALSVPISMALADMEIESLDRFIARIEEGGGAASLDIESVMVLDSEGRVVAHTDPDQFGRRYNDPFTQEAMQIDRSLALPGSTDGLPWMKVSLPAVSGKRWGTLIAVLRMDRVEQRVSASRNRMILATLFFSLLGGTGVFFILSRLVVKPIRALAETSRRIQEGHLEARVETRKTGRDEIEALKGRFNRMADQLQGYTRGLEEMVQERTRELQKTNQELLRAKGQLEELAITDGLTGAFNHWHLKNTLLFDMQRQQLSTHPLCYLMIDVDDFKHYNDANGHPAGDEALRIITRLLKDNVRDVDFIARYGGEEFAVILLDTSKRQGIPIAEKIRTVVESYAFPMEENQPGGNLTISLGMAAFPDDASDMDGLIRGADQALYRAKWNGKNRLELCH
jgi:diguanylate cyclase (GGDEF)-like protein